MHDNVSSQLERLLQVRRGKCVVDDHQAPAECAKSTIAAMSAMLSNGLVGVSIHTALVSPGVMAAATVSRLVRCAGRPPHPSAGAPAQTTDRCRRRRRPAPRNGYPGEAMVRSKVSSAAKPLAKASPCRPPSRAAMHSSRAVRVGFEEREYS